MAQYRPVHESCHSHETYLDVHTTCMYTAHMQARRMCEPFQLSTQQRALISCTKAHYDTQSSKERSHELLAGWPSANSRNWTLERLPQTPLSGKILTTTSVRRDSCIEDPQAQLGQKRNPCCTVFGPLVDQCQQLLLATSNIQTTRTDRFPPSVNGNVLNCKAGHEQRGGSPPPE